MRRRVPVDQIEQLVGATRHPHDHIGRAEHDDQRVYILHSADCLASGIDILADCRFSQALDAGIWEADWPDQRPVVLAIVDGYLTPNPDAPPTNPPLASESSR